MKLNKIVEDSSLLARAAERALELSRDEEITSKEFSESYLNENTETVL